MRVVYWPPPTGRVSGHRSRADRARTGGSMFKKTEESEWTRFSRALGGAQPTTPQRDEAPPADEPELPDTLNQLPEATTEPLAPPPPVRPEAAPEPEPTVAEAARPTVHASIPPLSAAMSRIPDLERGETVIGEGASVEGTVRSERSIRVRGAV